MKGRLIGGAIGAFSAAIGSSTRVIGEMASGETWIPERRQKERDIEEYFDVLKHLKYRSLFEEAAEEAMRKEHFDVKAYLAEQKQKGDNRKGRIRKLEQAKRGIVTEQKRALKDARHLVGEQEDEDAYLKAINREIEEIQAKRTAEDISPIAADAINYYRESEKTMYAFDPGDPIADVLSALPHKDQAFLNKFINAPKEERARILEVVPDYIKRILQASWGMKVDAKKDLSQYFKHHELPGSDWVGWDPRANLDDIKLKVVKKEGMDLSEFNMWNEDEQRASMVDDNVTPELRTPELNPKAVQSKLRELLGVAGLRDLEVEVFESQQQGIQMNMNIKKDMREEIKHKMNQEGASIFT